MPLASRSPIVFGFAALAGLLGCDRKEAPPQPSTTAAAPVAPAAPPAPEVRVADVQAVMATWQSAQNQGDFARYAALYDATFSGVKRVGEKSFRFDRKGWLEDRRTMFQRDVSVVVRDTRIFTGERSAFAIFVQEWSTPRFADVGQKRLEFSVRDGKLFISREEMLDSKTSGPGRVEAPPAEELALVVRLGKGYGAVLRTGGVEGTGPVRSIASDDALAHRVEKDASPQDVRPFQHLLGRRMDLYDGNTTSCSGRVTSFVAVTGVFGSDELGSDTSARGKADSIWEFAEAARYLAAVIEPEQPSCKAQWARASDLPSPTLFQSREPSAEESAKALSSLLETRAARDVQISYETFKREIINASAYPPSWAERSPEGKATLFVDPASQATYATIELSAGEGCGDFSGYALGFFKVTPGSWIDITGEGDPRSSLPSRPWSGIAPHTAIATRAGKPPFLIGGGGTVLYAQGPNGFVPVTTIGEIRTVCGC